jgi:uncharacterized OsmC-like protein
MSISVQVQRLPGKQLKLRARNHTVIADRTAADGGTDQGCTSGELLLMAIGSCSTGSLRNFLEQHGVDVSHLKAEVLFRPSPVLGQRDSIVIAVEVGTEATCFDDETLARAVTSGRVTSRIKLGSEVDVTISRRQ